MVYTQYKQRIGGSDMKRKAVEKLTPVKARKKGLIATVQEIQNILVLNIYEDKQLRGRYCMNTTNYEFQQLVKNKWKYGKLASLCGLNTWYCSGYQLAGMLKFNSEAEEELVKIKLKIQERSFARNAVELIIMREEEYSRGKRERTENNRVDRVQKLMNQIKALPEGIKEWIWQQSTGGADFAFFNKENSRWQCTNCEKSFEEKRFHSLGIKRVKHNDTVTCPECKKTIQAKKRTKQCKENVHFMILQNIDDEHSVARHFDTEILWKNGKRNIQINESVRIVLNKLHINNKIACELYYNQGRKEDGYAYFDNKGNPSQRKTYTGYLYNDGIEEALKSTAYEPWTRLFSQLAAEGKKLQYNRLMSTQNNQQLIRMVECLFKGRFDRLLEETSESIAYFNCEYYGPLKTSGKTIEEVFDIRDRQKINRIRDLNGGEITLRWMRYSDKSGEKIPHDVLEWICDNDLKQHDIEFISDRMSLKKIMNYIKRQQSEGYKGKSVAQILSQWQDYLKMCERMKKHTDDEMVYRPRELKRRHDEAVAEIELREAELEADEFSERFPGAEEVLKEIKHKYEFANEAYRIIVPERLIEIVKEGRALHHCAGSSDRYFDRIQQHETYICFLRKAEEPDVPFYTIEVEPGGTIRQHRGMFDEEPEIEKVKPFLKEWQKEIRKRMDRKEHERSAVSKVKREENIEELRKKNNTRVLEGLMEDFMEAM